MERSFDATVFTKNRQRLMAHDVGRALFDEVVWAADGEGAAVGCALQRGRDPDRGRGQPRSFRPKDEPAPPVTDDDPGNPSVNFRGERRSNETHASTTNPEAHLLRKGPGKEARVAFPGYALMENRHVMDFTVSLATGTAERDAVPELLEGVRERGYRPRTLGADRGYDIQDCVNDMRVRRVTPHVAQKKHSAIDGHTTRHAGYGVSLRIRKRVEEVFSWMKTVGGLRRTRYRSLARTGLTGYLVATAYNLVRMAYLAYLTAVSEAGPVPPGCPADGSARPPAVPGDLRGPCSRAWGPRRGIQGSSDHHNTASATRVVADDIPNLVLQQPARMRLP